MNRAQERMCGGANKFKCSDEQRARVVGGEACQWGESVDATNIFTSVWPDLTAVAERLWSPKKPQGGLDLYDGHRIRERLHHCRLRGRGVALAPPSVLYEPDASHASFATWRRWLWCAADASVGGIGGAAMPIEPAETLAELVAARNNVVTTTKARPSHHPRGSSSSRRGTHHGGGTYPDLSAAVEAVQAGVDERAYPGAVAIVADRRGVLLERAFGALGYGKGDPATTTSTRRSTRMRCRQSSRSLRQTCWVLSRCTPLMNLRRECHCWCLAGSC